MIFCLILYVFCQKLTPSAKGKTAFHGGSIVPKPLRYMRLYRILAIWPRVMLLLGLKLPSA